MQKPLPQTALKEKSNFIDYIFNLQKENQQKVAQSNSNERISKLKKM